MKDVNVEKIYELTPMQKGMLYTNLSNKQDASYHVQNAFWINENVAIDFINKALELLAYKHEVIRTAFMIASSTKKEWQVVLKNRKIEFEFINEEGSDETEVCYKVKKDDLQRGFDLQKDSLMRVKTVKFSSARYYFLFSFHHIIMDGWCLSLIFEDFLAYYLLLAEGKTVLELIDNIDRENLNVCSYSEYVQWINQRNTNNNLEYWKNLLDGYDTTIGILPLWNNDTNEEQVKNIDICFSHEESELVTAFAAENKITVNSIAETSWGILLQKYNGTDDIVFGKVVSGRNIPISGIEEKVGMFINTIPLRVNAKKNISFAQMAAEVYHQDLDSSSFDYCSLNEIQDYIGYPSNLFDTIFVFENYYYKEENQNKLKIEKDMGREQTSYPLSIKFELKDSIISFSIMYHPGIYTDEEAVIMSERLKNIIIGAVSEKNILVEHLCMISRNEYIKITNEFNNNNEKYTEYTINEVLERIVEENASRTAVVFDNEKATYSEFNYHANMIAHRLRSMGIKTGDFIAVIAEASIKTLESIYGVIKSSGAYIPIDPSLPEERIQFILQDCNPKVIITDQDKVRENIAHINLNNQEIWTGPVYNPENINKPSDVAYCIYTSGTTGKPKGVLVEHKGVPNLSSFFTDKLGINKEDGILQFASLGFDASVWEMTMGLLTGARLIVPTVEERASYELLVSLAAKENITVVTLPTQFYANMEGLRVRLVITAGSESDNDIVQKAITSGAEYINAYGPTEFTVAASYWQYHKSSRYRKIPIGKPISNSGIYILNGLHVCGIGVTGELCMAGIGIARGYLHKEELTEEKFVDNPFGKGKLYRSGDLARWLPDGNIEFLGRIDEQVKIRGFRIELKEIENVIKQVSNIKDAAVIVKEDSNKEKYISAYFVSDINVDINQLRSEIGKNLPQYMLPRYIMQIDFIPVTLSGKIDRNKLPDCTTRVESVYKEPENDTQKRITDIFQRVLNVPQVGIGDEFIQIGGNSLKAMKCIVEFKKEGYMLSISELLKYQTAERIADYILQFDQDGREFQGSDVTDQWDDMDGLIQHIDKKVQKMQKSLLMQKRRQKYKAAAIQKISYDKNLLKSGVFVELDCTNDADSIQDAINNVIKANGLLRSYLTKENGQIYINENILKEALDIPYVDISSASELLKKDVHKYYINYIYEKEIWNRENLFHELLYKLIVIRFSCNIIRIYMPSSHLIFDAMSAEIIENMMRKSLAGIPVMGDYYSIYLEDLEKGPQKISSEEISDIFKLQNIRQSLKNLNNIKKSDFKKVVSRIYIKDMKNFDEKLLWNISHKLFLHLLKFNFGFDDLSYAILSADRYRKYKNYYEGIGEYLDLIPMTYTFGIELNERAEETISKLIEIKNNHNINFASLAYNKFLEEQYLEISDIIKDFIVSERVPLFNFLGIYSGIADKLDDVDSLEEHLFWVDTCYENGYIKMSGFTKKEDTGGLQTELQSILDKM